MNNKHADPDLDERLRQAAQGLAGEPLPDGIFDRDLSHRPTWPRGVFGLVAGLLVMGSVAAFLRLSMAPPVGVASPSPEPSGTPHISEPPSTPPPGSVTPGDFVTLGCGDGIGGFIVGIPDGWYANSAHDGIPACRFVSTQPFVLNDVNDRPSVPITLSVRTGGYRSDGDLIERTEPSLEGGLPALRLVERVENGPRLVYIVGLDGSLPAEGSPNRYLLAMTMFGYPTYGQDRAALDSMFERFFPQDRYVHDQAAAAQADGLFAETRTCMNAELRFEVAYPASWFTNPATPEVPACMWFGPTELPAASATERPSEAVIGMRVYRGGVGLNAVSFFIESRNVGGRPAQLTEGYPGPPPPPEPDTSLRAYGFLVMFGDTIGGGPNLLASTDSSVSFDYQVAKEVLDRMMASLTLVE